VKHFNFNFHLILKIMFKKHIRIVFLTLFALVAFVSEAQNNTSLYLMNAQNGRVFDISALNGNLPTQTTTLSSEARSNLAVGPVPSNGSQSVFTSSNTLVNSPVYVANSSISTNLPTGLGGLTTNPNAGATFGHVYGISANRDLIKASPAPATNLGSISGDANWTNGTINGDGFFDNAGNLYTVAIVGTSKYLYKINISTRVATLVIQLSGALPENFQGLSFFNGRIYAVEGFISRLLLVVSSTFNARIYEINPNTGVGIVKTSYALNTQLLIFQGTDDLDLASGQLYVPSEAPTCNELFGIVRGTQEVYRINLNNLSTTLVANGDQTTHGNVAYGPSPTDLTSNRFVTTVNQNNGTIFSGLGSSSVTNLQSTSLQWNGPSGTNLAPVGIGTDPSTGVVWGISNKRLSRWTGTGNAENLQDITGDATWDSGVVLNDVAVDNAGNLYCIINVGTTNSWLYRINPTTLPPTASPVVKLNGTYASSGGVNGNGLAYLNGFFYYSRLNGTADTDIWRVNALTGATTYVGLIDGSGTETASTNRGFGDLASCATVTNVPASFGFNCNSSEGGLQNNQFIKNGNVQADVLRIPISSAINGIAAVNISGAGLSTNPSPYSIFV
jgi:hypothetical protein